MRKTFIILGLVFLILACNQNGQNSKSNNEFEKRKIDTFLTQIFSEKYSNYESNTLIREKALEELITKVDSLIPLKYLEDIPLEILRIKSNPHGKGAMVQFYTDNFEREKSKIFSNQLEFDVIGFMSEEL